MFRFANWKWFSVFLLLLLLLFFVLKKKGYYQSFLEFRTCGQSNSHVELLLGPTSWFQMSQPEGKFIAISYKYIYTYIHTHTHLFDWPINTQIWSSPYGQVSDPEKYNFKPRVLLRKISEIYVNLASDSQLSHNFAEAIARDGRSYNDALFVKAAQILRREALLPEVLFNIWSLLVLVSSCICVYFLFRAFLNFLKYNLSFFLSFLRRI